MPTVTKIKTTSLKMDIELRHWELAALAGAVLTFLAMSWCLLTDFSVRRILWPNSGEGQLAHPIGKVTYSLNKTLRQARDQPEFIALAQNDAVYPLDTLMAGPGSALKITLDDKTVVEVGENSMIRLNFDASLRLSGLNRETVVEVVAGTVAAQGSAKSSLKMVSHDKTYVVTQEKGIEVSRHGTQIATQEGKNFDLVARAKARLTAVQEVYTKMGGVMTSNTSTSSTMLSDIYTSMKGINKGSSKPLPTTGRGTLQDTGTNRTKLDVAMNTKAAEEMMKTPSLGVKSRVEMAKAFKIEPADNFSVKTETKRKTFEFPVSFSWKAIPEFATFNLRLSLPGAPDVVRKVKAEDGEVKFTQVLNHPGDYTWKIEDYGGAILSVRSLHINSTFQAIDLSDPVLVGRERGSKMWGAQDKWGFLFKWQPVKGVTQYKIKVARNVAASSSADKGLLAERVTTATEFILPFKKDWQAERMFFSVEAQHPLGFRLASNNVPFIFTFLPPKPRVPRNLKMFSRGRLLEGIININWEANSDADQFRLEIATDPTFRHKIEDELLSDNNYRFYPPEPGRYYWRVRGEKDTVSSPFSETWEFSLK